MKPSLHVASTGLAAGLIVLATGSWPAGLASCLTGVFIDLDHVWDYVLARRRIPRPREFFRFWAEFREERLYTWLHAWEFVPLLLLGSWLGPAREICLGLAWGLFQHLLLDQLGNGVTPGAYWLAWRWAKGFRSRYLLKSLQKLPPPQEPPEHSS